MRFQFWRKKTVRAREFVLEDENGRERAALRTDVAGNSLLHFRGLNGETRLFAGVTPEGTPRIALMYADGKGSIQLEANDGLDSAAIIISSPNSKAKVAVAIAPNGVPTIIMFNDQGETVFSETAARADKHFPPNGESFDWNSLLHN